MDPTADFAPQLRGLGGRDAYIEAAGEMLNALFPSEIIGWHDIDGAAGAAEIVPYPEIPLPGLAERLIETADENPFFQSYVKDSTAGMWRPRRLSDLVTDLELRRTRTYNLGLRPLGIDRQIVLLSARTGPVGVRAWAISRLHRDFSDNEVELAHRLQPALRLLELAYDGTGRSTGPESRAEDFALTPREGEILQLLAKGLTGVAIGHLLGVSPRTVAKHLEHAYAKLGCTNRIDALRKLKG